MNVCHSLLASAIGGEISGLIETSGLVAKAVLVILLIFSVGSWAIIGSAIPCRSWTLDPRKEAAKVKCPALAINGELDS